jgi:hypothetical protein
MSPFSRSWLPAAAVMAIAAGPYGIGIGYGMENKPYTYELLLLAGVFLN